MECVPFFCLAIPLGWLLFFYVLRPRGLAGGIRIHCIVCGHRFLAALPVPEACPRCHAAGTMERM